MIKLNTAVAIKTPAKLAGVIFLLGLLSGCQIGKSPEEVTRLFWQNLAQGRLDQAKQDVTANSQHLVNLQDIDKFSQVSTAEATENDDSDEVIVSVPTTITRNAHIVIFNTVLLEENNHWKVDYLKTQLNITMIPLGDVMKTLQNLGGAVVRELGQQLPLIQKEMESLGDVLKKQIDDFNRNIDKSQPYQPPQRPNNRNTI
jgi:hypothetical protein